MSKNSVEKPGNSKRFWWAVAIIGLSAILIVTLLTRPQAIQQDLLEKSRNALQNPDYNDLQVAADGRDLILRGTIANEVQLEDALRLVGTIPGVRKLDYTVNITPPVSQVPPAEPEQEEPVKLEILEPVSADPVIVEETTTEPTKPEPEMARESIPESKTAEPVTTEEPAVEPIPTEQAVSEPEIPTSPARLSLQREDDDRLVVEGELADISVLSNTLNDLSASMQIDNRLRQVNNTADADWLDALTPVLTSIPLITNANLDIRDGKLALSGNVESEETLKNIDQRLSVIDPNLLEVDSALYVVEPEKPIETFLPLEDPDITVEAGQGKLLVSGTLPTDEDVNSILETLSKHYKPEEIDNQLQVSDKVGEAAWFADLLDLLPGLKNLESARVTIKQGALTFSGAAGSEEVVEQQTQAAEAVAKHLDAKNEIVILQVEPEDKVMQLKAELAKISLKDILFETNSSEINPTSLVVLDQLAQLLKQFPDFPIIVAGHTDATGDDQWNQYLSQLRANSVRDYLIHNGVDTDRVSAIGYGESRPMTDNASPEGRARNRRIEINY